MKLGVVKRILKDDLARGGELPGWVDFLLQPLDEFIEKVGLALQGRLTFKDNFLSKTVTQTFQSGTTYQINPKINSNVPLNVMGVLLLDAGGGTVDKWQWVRNPNGNINVTITFSDVTSVTGTILILLGQ